MLGWCYQQRGWALKLSPKRTNPRSERPRHFRVDAQVEGALARDDFTPKDQPEVQVCVQALCLLLYPTVLPQIVAARHRWDRQINVHPNLGYQG